LNPAELRIALSAFAMTHDLGPGLQQHNLAGRFTRSHCRDRVAGSASERALPRSDYRLQKAARSRGFQAG